MMKRLTIVVGILSGCAAPAAHALDLIDFIPAGERAQLTTGCVTSDGYLSQAIAVLGAKGGDLDLPAGCLYFAHTIDLKTRLHIHGQGGGQAGDVVTKLQFAPNIEGIVVHRFDTGPGNVVLDPPTTGADGSIIEGVNLFGSGTIGNGIRLHARATIRQDTVNGFGENCIAIVADTNATGAGHGNANNWLIDTVRLASCGGSGLFVAGGDANAGLGTLIDATADHGWGIYDSSFLGNTYVQPHADSNWLGSYKTEDPSARLTFVNPYSESGQPPASFNSQTLILGGLQGAGMTGGAMVVAGNTITPFNLTRQLVQRSVVLNVGGFGGAGYDIAAAGDNYGMSFGYWDEASKTYQFRWAQLEGRVSASFTSGLFTGTDEAGNALGGGRMIMPFVWVRLPNGKYRAIEFLNEQARTAALEVTAASQAATIANLLARVSALEAH